MTDPQMSLHGALARATEAIETPSLAAVALRSAKKRRVRRRGAVAAVLSSGLVVAVVVATTVGGTTSVAPPPTAPSPSITIPPTPSPSPSPSNAERQPWDPRTVDDLPAADPGVAPLVPDTIEPPSSSPLLSDEPIEAAVLALEDDDAGGVVQVLSTDGEWRSIPLEAAYPSLSLSPDGRQLAVTYCCGDAGPTVFDLSRGASRDLPEPTGFRSSDFTTWTFADDDTLFSTGVEDAFEIDVTTGTGTPVGHGADAFDNDGAALEVDCCVGPLVLTDWSTGEGRRVSLKQTGRLQTIHADEDTVVGTWARNGSVSLGVVVTDRATLTPREVLPIQDDPEANYANGYLSVLALGDDGTVFLRVGLFGGNREGFRVVAWSPGSGELSLVTSNPVSRQVAFADGLLRQVVAAAPEVSDSAPPIDESLVQPLWNPNGVGDLPVDSSLPLPAVLDPSRAGDLPDGPAMAASDQGDEARLLGADGSWSSVDYPEPGLPYVGRTLALEPSGSRLWVTGESALWSVPTTGGGWTRVTYPADFRTEYDWGPTLSVTPGGRVLLGQYKTWWIGDGDTWTTLPFGIYDEVVPGGDDVVAERFSSRRGTSVDVWRDGAVVSSTDTTGMQSLQRPAADADSIVMTQGLGGYSGERTAADSDGLLALDRDGLTTRALLPVPSGASYYSDNGGLTPMGWLGPDTVLVAVRPKNDFDTTTLVTWNVETGELRRSASYATDTRVVVAIDALQP